MSTLRLSCLTYPDKNAVSRSVGLTRISIPTHPSIYCHTYTEKPLVNTQAVPKYGRPANRFLTRLHDLISSLCVPETREGELAMSPHEPCGAPVRLMHMTPSAAPDPDPDRSVLRCCGGKRRLTSWSLNHFPPHRVSVESNDGTVSVLMHKPRSDAEVYNDCWGPVMAPPAVADHGHPSMEVLWCSVTAAALQSEVEGDVAAMMEIDVTLLLMLSDQLTLVLMRREMTRIKLSADYLVWRDFASVDDGCCSGRTY